MAGADNMAGGTGNDTYYVDNAGDVVTEAAGAGTDAVIASINYTLGANVENLTLAGAAAINGTGNTLANTLTGNAAANVLDGSAGADTMVGGAGDDTYVVDVAGDVVTENLNEGIDLVQTGIAYTLGANVENLTLTGSGAVNGTGNALANRLVGNSGANVLTGGDGDDVYVVGTGDTTIELAAGGIDTVESNITWTLAAEVERLTLTGTGAINGTGNTLANTLTGNSGNNVLDGAAGADAMAGGLGNDTYMIDNAGDVVTENLNEGTDLVQSNVSYTLGANLENLTLLGTTALNGTGNALNNVLTGNTGINILDGGAGADTMVGGAGDDTYYVDNAGDVTTEVAAGGTDTVVASVSWTLGAEVERLTLAGTTALNGTGNALANTLIGNAAANVLSGGAGADTMLGGAGDDTYVVDVAGDVVTENLNEGIDLVQAGVAYTLGANVENLTLTGTGAINGTGNALANRLVGNTGANVLTGGAGDDVYVVGTGDTTIEAAGGGIDTVESNITWTLATEVERLTLTGTGAINGTGNTLANTLAGNAANNVLDGGTGADTMAGGAGDDTYVVDVAGDVITENLNEGTDLVQTGIAYTLGANLENLTLTGSGAINGTGNALANRLVGNTGINVLTGGAGDDVYVVGTGDTTIEVAAGGIDTVESNIAWTLANEVENLTLTGSTAINGTGNGLANLLLGNTGANTLTGGAGNDTLDGKAGADSLVGGVGSDTYLLGRGYGIDTITENDATAGNTDIAKFDATVATNQLWFVKVGNNLEVSIMGTTDKFVMTNWYLGSQYHVEQFRSGDGKTLLDSQVQNLVSAMAAFTPPAAGVTTLPANYATTLQPVLAANWV
jgi:trimeric autotransporter adhesin